MKYWDEKNKRLMTAAEKAEKEAAEKTENTETISESAGEETEMMDFGGAEAKTTKKARK